MQGPFIQGIGRLTRLGDKSSWNLRYSLNQMGWRVKVCSLIQL